MMRKVKMIDLIECQENNLYQYYLRDGTELAPVPALETFVPPSKEQMVLPKYASAAELSPGRMNRRDFMAAIKRVADVIGPGSSKEDLFHIVKSDLALRNALAMCEQRAPVLMTDREILVEISEMTIPPQPKNP